MNEGPKRAQNKYFIESNCIAISNVWISLKFYQKNVNTTREKLRYILKIITLYVKK